MRKISTINTIEVSSLCNLKCRYCAAPIQGQWRKVGNMSMETFKKAISWVKEFACAGTQQEVNLFGIGEPLMNSQIVDMVAHARNTLPLRQVLHFNTNGVLMTEKVCRELQRAGLTSIGLTGHDPYHTIRCHRMFKAMNVRHHLSMDFVLSPNDWAGQVEWFKAEQSYPCPWLGKGQATVLWDGRITICCWDAKAAGELGTIHDDLSQMYLKPFELCKTCHQQIPGDMEKIIPIFGGQRHAIS